MSSDQLTLETLDIDDQDEHDPVDEWPVRQLQNGHRNAVALGQAINETNESDGIEVADLLETAGSVVWTAVDLLKQFGRWTLSAWPLVLLGLLSVRLWFAFGLSYFEADALSWTTALALYGLGTALYLSHRALSRYWWFYNRIRVERD